MKKIITTIAVVVVGLGAGLASVPAHAGWYVGASALNSCAQLNDDGAAVPLTKDDSSNGANIFVGYQMSPRFAFEVGYTDLGTASATIRAPTYTVEVPSTIAPMLPAPPILSTETNRITARGISFSLISYASVGAGRVFAEAGMVNWQATGDNSVSGPFLEIHSPSNVASGVSPLLGTGFEWPVTDHLDLRASIRGVSNIGDKDKTGQMTQVIQVGIGVTYHLF